jgi:hypothetical protein
MTFTTPPSEYEATSLAASAELAEMIAAELEKAPGLTWQAARARVVARSPELAAAYGGDAQALAEFRARGRTADLGSHGGKLLALRQTVNQEPLEVSNNRLLALELLKVGTWNGIRITPADLRDLAANAELAGYRVPLKLGHTKAEDAAAHGWLTRIRVEDRPGGPVLVADAEAVPAETLALIRARRFDAVSCELWQDIARDGHKFRLLLKAVALLGAHPPAVSGLRPVSESVAA